MQQDLEGFEIPQSEIEQLTGIPEIGKTLPKEEYDKLWKEKYDNEVNSKCGHLGSLILLVIGGTFLAIALALIALDQAVAVLAWAFLVMILSAVGGPVGLVVMEDKCKKKHAHEITNTVNQYMTTYQDNYNKRYTPPPTLNALLKEIERYYNVVKELVYNINVIDQLAEAGEPVTIKDREHVLAAFRGMKADLIRALKVDRILRENPNFKPELFSVNFAPLQDLQLSQQVANGEQLVNEALQIGLRVQETMRTYGKAILKEAQEKMAGIESIEKS